MYVTYLLVSSDHMESKFYKRTVRTGHSVVILCDPLHVPTPIWTSQKDIRYVGYIAKKQFSYDIYCKEYHNLLPPMRTLSEIFIISRLKREIYVRIGRIEKGDKYNSS